MLFVGEADRLRHEADRRDRDVPVPQAEAVRIVQQRDGIHHRVVVLERFAHAHEHDVGDPYPAVRELAREVARLIEDFGRVEVARESGLTGRAERAARRRSRLDSRCRPCCARCSAPSAPLRLRCRRQPEEPLGRLFVVRVLHDDRRDGIEREAVLERSAARSSFGSDGDRIRSSTSSLRAAR